MRLSTTFMAIAILLAGAVLFRGALAFDGLSLITATFLAAAGLCRLLERAAR